MNGAMDDDRHDSWMPLAPPGPFSAMAAAAPEERAAAIDAWWAAFDAGPDAG